MARPQTQSQTYSNTNGARHWSAAPTPPDECAPPVVFDEDRDHDRARQVISALPAVAADSMINGPLGSQDAGDIRAGDLLMTRNNGARAVRWAGHIRIRMLGNAAPITFGAGVFGISTPVILSPCQPLLFQGWRSELACGAPQTLIRASDLINGISIRRRPDGATITYISLFFDTPEIIQCNGLLLACPGLCDAADFNAISLDLPPPDPASDRLGPPARFPIAAPEQAREITGSCPVIW